MKFWSRLAGELFLTPKPALRFLVGGLFLLVAFFRLSFPDVCYFNEFAERDWYRTLEIHQGRKFHLSGAELTLGGRLPGPWQYWIQLIPMALSRDPVSLFLLIGLFGVAASYIAYRFAVEFLGVRAGVLTLALVAVFPLATLGLRYLWNPCLLFPFVGVTFYCLVASLRRPRLGYLYAMAVAIPIASNCHATGLYLAVLAVAFFLVFRPGYSGKHYAVAGLVFGLMFAPFLVGEAQNGFQNIRCAVALQDKVSMAGWEFTPSIVTRYSFNSSAWEAVCFNLAPRFWNEYPYFGAFSYYTLFVKYVYRHSPGVGGLLLYTFTGLARLQLGLFLLSWIYGLCRLVWLRYHASPSNRLLRGALFIGTVFPFFVFYIQSFLVVSGSRASVGSGVHYFFIIAPAQFWLMACFLADVLTWLERRRQLYMRYRIVACLIVGLAFQGVFVLAELRWSHRSGYFVQWLYDPVANLGTMRKVADTLVDRLGITRQTYLSHVKFPDPVLGYAFGSEAGLDYLINSHPHLRDRSLRPERFLDFVYVVDPGFNHYHPLPTRVKLVVPLGAIQLLVSPEGIMEPFRLHHPNLNPFVHLSSDKPPS